MIFFAVFVEHLKGQYSVAKHLLYDLLELSTDGTAAQREEALSKRFPDLEDSEDLCLLNDLFQLKVRRTVIITYPLLFCMFIKKLIMACF